LRIKKRKRREEKVERKEGGKEEENPPGSIGPPFLGRRGGGGGEEVEFLLCYLIMRSRLPVYSHFDYGEKTEREKGAAEPGESKE